MSRFSPGALSETINLFPLAVDSWKAKDTRNRLRNTESEAAACGRIAVEEKIWQSDSAGKPDVPPRHMAVCALSMHRSAYPSAYISAYRAADARLLITRRPE